ncbi:MAG: glycosyltransferase family 4 protein [Bacteroidota bacterium]
MEQQLYPGQKVLFLALTCFGDAGGVQRVGRILGFTLASICSLTPKSTFEMHVLYDSTTDQEYIPSQQLISYNGSKLKFLLKAVIKGRQQDWVILSHIHLLPIALCIRLFNSRTRIALVAHGIEIWVGLSPWIKRFLRREVSIWAVSHFTKRTVVNTHNVSPQTVQVVNNCLDPFFKPPGIYAKPLNLLQRYKLSSDDLVMLTVCRMNRYEHKKGYDIILELIPKLITQFPRLKYLIGGQIETQELHRIQRLISRLDIETYVKFLGFIPEMEMEQHYVLCDLFVLPSQKEGFGLVFIEAAACGCPVIAGNIDGSKDALLNGQLGAGVNPNDPNEVNDAIVNVLKAGRSDINAEKIQAICVKHFSQSQYQEKIKTLLYEKQTVDN